MQRKQAWQKSSKEDGLQGPAKKKATKKSGKGVKRPVHADAVIIKAFMHHSAKRMEIQAKCKLSDGTLNTIGIVGLMPHKSANFADIGRALLAKCKDGSGMTKGECIKARDEMLAAEMSADEMLAYDVGTFFTLTSFRSSHVLGYIPTLLACMKLMFMGLLQELLCTSKSHAAH